MQDTPDLAALIGSRICHDLISPIGAIGNGVELMLLEHSASPELALIAQSTAAAGARIRFFRLAFGTAGGDQRIARAEVAGILSDLTAGGRLAITLTAASDLPRPEMKLICLLVMCLESALPWGGQIAITQTAGGWQLAATAARMKVDAALWAGMVDPQPAADAPAVTPAQVHFALVPGALAALDRRLTLAQTDTTLRLAC